MTEDPQIITGDALAALQALPDGIARCCVTSPPYWGLRDYGTGSWDGGDTTCDHLRVDGRREVKQTSNAGTARLAFSSICNKCGARWIDQQLGLEPTPEEYVARLVEIMREVRRVLADDGTLFLNLGDSYSTDGQAQTGRGDNGRRPGSYGAVQPGPRVRVERSTGLAAKNIVGIPWRVAFALQSDGWWLRSDIIWAKPNPMPESVTNRPTRAHEYVFLLSKSQRYFYDADAIREPHTSTYRGHKWPEGWAKGDGPHDAAAFSRDKTRRNPHARNRRQAPEPGEPGAFHAKGRNIRSVWTIATQPCKAAHFATFPEELARRCVLAGSAEGDLVLDPFAGAGTTGFVALKAARRFLGIELNPDYVAMAERRLAPLIAQGRLL